MQTNLNISQKGLILVSVPLICELIFVGALTHLLNQAETAIKREAHSKEVVATTNSITRIMVDGSGASAIYKLTGSRTFLLRYQQSMAQLMHDVGVLEELVKDDPAQSANLRAVKDGIKRGLFLLEKVNESAGEGPNLGAMRTFEILPQVKSCLTELSVYLNRIVEEETHYANAGAESAARARARVQQTLMLGVILNVVLAFILALFFSKGITHRLKNVMDNTVRLPKGETLNPLLTGKDEIAQLDRVFHKMADDLQEADKMKRQLMAMITHDLRTPLTSVQGILTLVGLGASGDIPESARSRLQIAESEIERLVKLSNDLLDIEGLASGRMELHLREAQAENIVSRAVNALGTLAEQHAIKLVHEPVQITLKADEGRLVQVLVNLISNAIKFSPADSSVEIAVARSEQGMVEFRVKDQGRGVPPQYQQVIFEKFKQVEASDKQEKGGSGLGLAICKTIVEQHGGTIGIEGKEGKGSTFWFRIPQSPV